MEEFTYSAKFIRKLRRQKGLTQKELSEILGYASPQYVSNIERGLSGISITMAEKISKSYSVPLSELVSLIAKDKANVFKKRNL